MHYQIKDTKKTYTQPPKSHVATSPPPLSIGCADLGWALPVLLKSQAEESWGSSCCWEQCWRPAAAVSFGAEGLGGVMTSPSSQKKGLEVLILGAEQLLAAC